MSDRSHVVFRVLGHEVPPCLQDNDDCERDEFSTRIEIHQSVGGGFDEIEQLIRDNVTFSAFWEGVVGAYPEGLTYHHTGRRVDFASSEGVVCLRCPAGEWPSDHEITRFKADLEFRHYVKGLLYGRGGGM